MDPSVDELEMDPSAGECIIIMGDQVNLNHDLVCPCVLGGD